MSVIVKMRYKQKGVMVGATEAYLWKHDHGQTVTLLNTNIRDGVIIVYFAKNKLSEAIETVATASNGEVIATVPDQLLNGTEAENYVLDCYAFVTDEESGTTEYYAKIPVIWRQRPSEEVPTPAQASAIEQAITELNRAVEQTGQDVESASASATSAVESAAEAETSADRAEQAAATSGWLYFEIIGGYLWLERTPSTEIDFYLDNGDLWMEAIE